MYSDGGKGAAAASPRRSERRYWLEWTSRRVIVRRWEPLCDHPMGSLEANDRRRGARRGGAREPFVRVGDGGHRSRVGVELRGIGLRAVPIRPVATSPRIWRFRMAPRRGAAGSLGKCTPMVGRTRRRPGKCHRCCNVDRRILESSWLGVSSTIHLHARHRPP